MLVFFRCVTFAAVSSLCLASIARSEPSAARTEQVGSVRVGYADLDLQKEADARVLLGRLERAAYTACGGNPKFDRSYELMPSYTQQVYRACRETALVRAVDNIRSPTLSRLFAERHKVGKRDNEWWRTA